MSLNKICDDLAKKNHELKEETKILNTDLIDKKIHEDKFRKEISTLESKNKDQSLTINDLVKKIDDNCKNLNAQEKIITQLKDEIKSLEDKLTK